MKQGLFLNKNQRYHLHWFWQDAIFPYRFYILRINALEILGVAAELSAYGIIVLFVRTLQSEGKLPTTLQPLLGSPSISNILLFATLAATLLFIANALLRYLSRRMAIVLSMRYEKFCTLRLISMLRDRGGIHQTGFPYKFKKALIKDSRMCGSLLKGVSAFLAPVIKISASVLYMFNAQVWITLLVLLLLLPAFYFLRRQIIKTVRATQEKERLLPSLIGWLLEALNPKTSAPPHEIQRHAAKFGHAETDNFYERYYRVGILASQNQLIVQLAVAVMTFVVLTLAGNYFLREQLRWDVLITFILALQFFFRNLQGLTGIAKQISRKFDYVIQYHTMLNKIRTLAPATTAAEGVFELLSLVDDQDEEDEDDEDFD